MAGNWKMNLDHYEALHLVQKLAWALEDAKHDYADVEVAVLAPFTDLRSVQTLVHGDRLRLGYGAQDVSPHDSGAHTGDVSGAMLAKLECRYVVVGHSERRADHHETDEIVNAKVQAARRHGLVAILCVGEDLAVRAEGDHVEHSVAQLRAALVGVTVDAMQPVVLAYEPVWAIGTGEVATPADAQEVCAALRTALAERCGPEAAEATRILYGGSVKGSNAAEMMAGADVDGALVGGASLDVEDFVRIVRFAAG